MPTTSNPEYNHWFASGYSDSVGYQRKRDAAEPAARAAAYSSASPAVAATVPVAVPVSVPAPGAPRGYVSPDFDEHLNATLPHRDDRKKSSIFDHVTIDDEHAPVWAKFYKGVVIPSTFTKIVGRGLMLLGRAGVQVLGFKLGVPMAGTVAAGTFILLNLAYAAPPVALVAGLVRFTYELYQARKAGHDWKTSLKIAGKAALITAIKFFVVYMAWVLGMALVASMLAAGGWMLILGFAIVALITAAAFAVVSFFTDILPDFKNKWRELKDYILPAILEGGIWAAIDTLNLVDILTGIGASDLGGSIVDALVVMVCVTAAFFVGVVINSIIKKAYYLFKSVKPVTGEKRDNINLLVRAILSDQVTEDVKSKLHSKPGEAAIDLSTTDKLYAALKKDKNLIKDPRFRDLIEQYIKYTILLRAIQNTNNKSASHFLVATSDADRDILAQRRNHSFSPISLCKETRSAAMLRKAETLAKELTDAESITDSRDPKFLSYSAKAEKQGQLIRIRKSADRQQERATKGLQKWGLFKPGEMARARAGSLPAPVSAAAAA